MFNIIASNSILAINRVSINTKLTLCYTRLIEVSQRYYEMSNKRTKLDFSKYYNTPYPKKYRGSNKSIIAKANEFNNGKRQLPLTQLEESITGKKDHDKTDKYLINWFRNDLRVQDNKSLYHAIKDAHELNKKVLGLYVISTKFWFNHLDSPWKINLIERTLDELTKDLNELNIPLSIVYLNDHEEEDIKFADWFTKLLKDRFEGSKSVYFNYVYDFDEIQRDLSLVPHDELKLNPFHDACTVKPLTLTSGKGTQYSKFSPWFKKWDEFLNENPIELFNLDKKKDKFPQWDYKTFNKKDSYDLPLDLQLSSLSQHGVTNEDIAKFKKFYQPGEKFALKLLQDWLSKSGKTHTSSVYEYQSSKDAPAKVSTSRLSGYITIGAISPRTIVYQTQEINSNKRNSGNQQIVTFIKEVAWRDFYKHILINWPFLEFNIPFKYESLDLKWSDDKTLFEKWCLGQTGFPIVDAAMRQLLHTGYLNNRCRMIVSSFLTKDLNQHWRLGEDWFHHHLVDGDFSSNNGGWGWSSSTGIDSQPWFRIFNVYTQSEKIDPDGEFIKTWVEELKDVEDKNSLHTGENVEGYIEPIVDRSEAREEALDRFREVYT